MNEDKGWQGMIPDDVTVETAFVAGANEINTGNCGSYGDGWDSATREEAERIALGLHGQVVEETPDGITTWEVEGRTYKSENLLSLAVLVDGNVVARVYASRPI